MSWLAANCLVSLSARWLRGGIHRSFCGTV